jgi:hypothetical protein
MYPDSSMKKLRNEKTGETSPMYDEVNTKDLEQK